MIADVPAANAPRARRIPNEERLFNLVLALLDAERGLTKSELFARVRGYQDRFAQDGPSEALEKQFDRDKARLRDLGIPLETVDSPDHPGDGRFARYRIRRDAYALPESVRFTADELSLLMLAAESWADDGAMSAAARRAAMKLRAFGVAGAQPLVGYAPRIRVRDTAFAPLRDALERSQAVSFDYFTPGSAGPRLRRIDPLALIEHEGRWHLHGRDRDLDAPRTFLLSRISGEVRPLKNVPPLPPAPEGVDVAERARLLALRDAQTALVRLAPGSEAELRLGRRAFERDGDRVRLHYTDAIVLADELAGYGPEVLVVEPASLVELVVERLRAVAAAHGAGVASSTDPDARGGGR